MKIQRYKGFFLRHLYPLQRNFDLLSDMIYWPLIDIVLWGVTSAWLVSESGQLSLMASILIGLLLWQVLWRSQSEISRNLIDELWNRNLINLFSTPLSIKEWIFGVILLSIVKTGVTISFLAPVVWLLYKVSLFAVGWWLPAFFVSVVMTGWWVGFLSAGIVLRYGPKVQTVVWSLPGILLPFSAVFYPLAKLPAVAKPISYLLPTTYTFEAMRAVLAGQPVLWQSLGFAAALNIVYLSLAMWFFVKSFTKSLELGLGRFD